MFCSDQRRDRLTLGLSFLAVLIFGMGSVCYSLDFNTVMMESTFKIEGGNSVGTAFVLGRPSNRFPGTAYYVLITAAHVMQGISENTANLHVREKHGPNSFSRKVILLTIRKDGKPLWTQHPDPEIDIAAMYLILPPETEVPLLTTNRLANNRDLVHLDIHPGDELFCLGYPFGAEASAAGFPILRSGKIASYPLVPADSVKTFLFDFEVFQGNSGGPVYLYEIGRAMRDTIKATEAQQYVIGMVTQEKSLTYGARGPFSKLEQKYPLGLAVVIHAHFIKEVVNLLPDLDKVDSGE